MLLSIHFCCQAPIMAGAKSPHFFSLAFMCLFYCFFVLSMHVPPSSSISFSFNFSNTLSNPCEHDIVCCPDAEFVRTAAAIELTRNLDTPPLFYSKGRVWYKQRVPLWNKVTGEVASFTTRFSFNITTTNSGDYENPSSRTGDGMAFFLAPYPKGCIQGHAAAGRDLNLFNNNSRLNATGDDRVVAVEFDTYAGGNNLWDTSSYQHVGIDVNSIKSVATTDTPGMNNLTSPFTKVAVIRYDNTTKLLAVDLRINGAVYNVSATVNLTQSLPDTVAVGFSASTGKRVELHELLSWSFSSTLQEPKAKPSAMKLLLGVLVPIGSVLVCVAVGVLLWKTRAKSADEPCHLLLADREESDEEINNAEAAAIEMMSLGRPRRYSYRDLATSTGGFAEENLLGQGGFGRVYLGHLPAGSTEDNDHQQPRREVAIKKFSSETSSQSRKEFEAEVKIIGRLRHRNLVQLLGWCDSRRGLLLVYELMPEGSLDKHIYSTDKVLNWPERYNIILGLGSALHYLHRDWDQRVVHGDIKPSNIMLDSCYNAKLGDFGLARLGDHGADPKTTDLVMGTMGYIDPEFVNTRRRSTESDIYSFGIVLLEIVSGRPPVDRLDPSFSLLKWVETLYCQAAGGRVLDAADARLRRGDDAHDRQMERTLNVGLWCTHPDPRKRPSITQVMHVLQ